MATRRRLPEPETLESWDEHYSRSTSEESGLLQLRTSEFAGYRVERIISTGSMGRVVAARHQSREGLLVIKLLHPELRDDARSVARLSHEAHVLARVASAHIVRLLDAGWTAEVGPYLVLEHLEGQDLARMLEERGPLPAALAVELVLQACAALGVAHAAGIIHRDIKPENLFAVAGGAQPLLKLLDFGISQHGPESFPYRDVAAANDAAAPLLGTPAYMAPECILERPNVDQRSDIWSLGVVLHELLTQRSLFERPGVSETCTRVVNHRFELESDRSLLPPPLRAVIARCLARRVIDRYQSVDELAAALRNAVQSESSRGFLTGRYQRLPQPAAPARLAAAVRACFEAPGGRARTQLLLWVWLVAAMLAVAVLALRVWL
jgi:eukaryotic-like serine/threonine-protein kinase